MILKRSWPVNLCSSACCRGTGAAASRMAAAASSFFGQGPTPATPGACPCSTRCSLVPPGFEDIFSRVVDGDQVDFGRLLEHSDQLVWVAYDRGSPLADGSSANQRPELARCLSAEPGITAGSPAATATPSARFRIASASAVYRSSSDATAGSSEVPLLISELAGMEHRILG